MWRDVPFACQRRPIIGLLRMCWLLPGPPVLDPTTSYGELDLWQRCCSGSWGRREVRLAPPPTAGGADSCVTPAKEGDGCRWFARGCRPGHDPNQLPGTHRVRTVVVHTRRPPQSTHCPDSQPDTGGPQLEVVRAHTSTQRGCQAYPDSPEIGTIPLVWFCTLFFAVSSAHPCQSQSYFELTWTA